MTLAVLGVPLNSRPSINGEKGDSLSIRACENVGAVLCTVQ